MTHLVRPRQPDDLPALTEALLEQQRAFFVGTNARRLGVGRELLRTAVDSILESGGFPCLEVIPVFPAALGLYESTGWTEVLRTRPDWLADAPGSEGLEVVVMVRS